jgi:hypothetical protein
MVGFPLIQETTSDVLEVLDSYFVDFPCLKTHSRNTIESLPSTDGEESPLLQQQRKPNGLFITVYQEDLLPLTDACQANGM